AGVELLDGVGPEVLGVLRDGDTVRLLDGDLYRGDSVVASGVRQSAESVSASLEASEAGLSAQMEAFAASAAEYLRREHHLLLDPARVPTLGIDLSGKDVIVVAPGPDHRDDLKRLRRFAKEHKPVVIAVDEAADTARELGYKPAAVIGTLTNVSEEALRGATDLVLVLDSDADVAGLGRIDRMGLSRATIVTSARPDDLALLVADEAGARVIVSAGTDRTLVSMLDSGRTEAAADFVTRLRVGARLVDAQAVAALHRPRVSGAMLALMLLVAVVALGVALWLTPTGQDVVRTIGDSLPASVTDVIDSVRAPAPEESSP
ncbi:MAG: putative cytokinetic ring protein SteA, partial [Jiangellales bacterium]